MQDVDGLKQKEGILSDNTLGMTRRSHFFTQGNTLPKRTKIVIGSFACLALDTDNLRRNVITPRSTCQGHWKAKIGGTMTCVRVASVDTGSG